MHRMTCILRKQKTLLVSGLVVLFWPAFLYAQEEGEEAVADEGDIEEIVVTAQRVAENIQDVPLSVSAFTAQMIEDQQIITPSDIQLNTPSVSFSSRNFGGFSFNIRGIGNLVSGSAAEPGVSAHLNEIPVVTNLNNVEFFDLQRVEILRGPQGTLFGRNATGGAVNFVTNKPDFSRIDGNVDFEVGTEAHNRLKLMFNLPLFDGLAIRVAGMQLQRDGYIENLAAEHRLPGIDDRLDGRNQYAFRVTTSWELNDSTSAWFLVSVFEEDSDRARITNQICSRNSMPTTGCDPNEFGFDNPHLGATTGGIVGGLAGTVPLGDSGDPATGVVDYRFDRPSDLGFRKIHTDVDPLFQQSDRMYAFGLTHEIFGYQIDILAATHESDYVSQQDYIMDVGPTMAGTAQNPSGIWPTSMPSRRKAGGEWVPGGQCSMNSGKSGVLGGCIFDEIDGTRMFSIDQASYHGTYTTVEAKLRSQLEGPMNYVVGVLWYDRERATDYFVISNTLDIVTRFGAPAIALPPLYPGYFLNSAAPDGNPGRLDDGNNVFGEVYYDISEDMQLSLGLRYNDDNKVTSDTSVLFNAINHLAVLQGVYQGVRAVVAQALGVPVEFIPLDLALGAAYQQELLDPQHLTHLNAASGVFWSRTLNLLLGPFASGAPEIDLAMHYGVTQQQIDAALLTPAYSAARVAISNQVPIVPQFGEARALTGSPDNGSWSAVTGRAALEYHLNADTLLYGSLSTGYKPGGLNAAIPETFQGTSSFTFDREDIFAMEVGAKSYLMDGRLKLNGSFFVYDYGGLQATRIKNNSAIQENIDASIWGLELEGSYRPAEIPRFAIDYSYSFLNTSVDGTQSLDPINRLVGANADEWVLLNNIDFGALIAINYIARKADITQAVVDAALAARRTADIRNGLTPVSVSYPENEHGVSIPAYFSRAFLEAMGVETSDGLLTELDGNSLPNSPEHSFKIGFEYSIPVNVMNGLVTLRWDSYWQSESYSREFNTPGDEIDAWSQHNASVIYLSGDGKIGMRAWIRNIQNDDNVTGMYLTSDTSGFFRNYFLTEPRIMGLSVRYALN